jgi:hypothetical protein
MQFSDAEALPPADVAEFVTYMTPEYEEEIDDGTDLPLPDIASLVLPAPEPRGRRSRPEKLLRETIADPGPAESESSSSLESEHGVFAAGVVTDDSAPQVKNRETASTQSTERSPEKTKRRRRRRNRGGRGGSSSRDETTPHSSKAAGETTKRTQPQSSSADSETNQLQTPSSETGDSDAAEGKPKPRKRRRRRRRGPRKSPNGSSGDNGESGAAPVGGSET